MNNISYVSQNPFDEYLDRRYLQSAMPQEEIDWYKVNRNELLDARLKQTNEGVNLLLYFICSIWICIAYVGYTLVERSATRPHNS